jgi:hypothetical protein
VTTQTQSLAHPVSRAEIVAVVGSAFGGRPVSTAEVLLAARDAGARPGTIATLERLPTTHFRSVRELWAHLPDLPVR